MTLWRKRGPAAIAEEIRAELDQEPKWWDRAFNDLVRQTFIRKPFNPDEHAGHDIIEVRTFGGATVLRECTECQPKLVPRG
jgi:hypothetical protein